MRRRSLLVVALAPVVLAVAVCACDSSRVRSVLGIPALSPAGALDFDTMLAETSRTRTVTLSNNGPAPLDVLSATVLGVDELTSDFPAGGLTIKEHSWHVVTFTWRPSRAGKADGRIRFAFARAYVGSGGSTLDLKVSGTAVSGCSLEPGPTLDFGTAAIDSTTTRPLAILNPTPVAWNVVLSALEDPAGAFGFNGMGPGPYEVPPARRAPDGTWVAGELDFAFDFRPTSVGEFAATIELQAPSACGDATLRLRGTAVRDLVRCSPTSSAATGPSSCQFDFGFVPLGDSASRHVLLQNIATRQPVTLSQIHLSGSAAFTLDPLTPRDSIVLDPGANIWIRVLFTPAALGHQSAQLVYFEDSGSRPHAVSLSGFGGAPRVAVEPLAVDFGRFAVDNALARKVTVANVGDVFGSSEGNLRFAARDHQGWHTAEPEVEPGPDSSEFVVVRPIPALETGIPAGDSVGLVVRFVPHSPGDKAATLLLSTNDPDAPTVRVPLKGSAEVLPPCEYEATARALDFGEVAPGEQLELALRVRNIASDPTHLCLLRDAAIVGTAFDFAAPAADPMVIPAGGAAVFRIRFRPEAESSYAATARFTLSNPSRPSLELPLSGQGSESCLLLLPKESVEFGVARTGCKAQSRSLFVYNACAEAVHLDAIDLVPGGSAQFALTVPSLGEVPPLSSLGATLAYRPIDDGADFGAVAARVTMNLLGSPQQHRLVRALNGVGAQFAQQQDTFQTIRPRVDVLFIVDNSATMDSKQAQLASNFSTFLSYLNGTDYRVAVTTTSTGCSTARLGCENGHFVPLFGGPRVITPTMSPRTPAEVFASNVRVGTNGRSNEMLLEPMVLALSPPLVRRENAGFLRDDATLAVVIVSDAADETDPTPIDYYEDFLLGLKGEQNRSMITVAAVVPINDHPPTGCQYEFDDSGAKNVRVRDLAARFNGPVRDICSSDWSSAFADIGKSVVGYHTEFPLTAPADSSAPISVSLDDVPFPAVGPRGELRWWYASTPRPRIVFDTLAQPDFGTTVTVRYSVGCAD